MNKFILLAAIIGAAYAVPTVKVTGTLSSTLESQKTADIIISFVGSNIKALSSIKSQSFKTRGERLNALGSSLKAHRDASQENVHKFLKGLNIPFKSFWISNQISIKGATKYIIQSLTTFPEIEIIDQHPIFTLASPISSETVPQPNPNAWGVNLIQAPEAWAITNGTGVTVATIDAGANHKHEAVSNNFRTDGYGWFDAYDLADAPYPFKHGTHVIGILAGSKGVGVSPGSEWMTCRGCLHGRCFIEELIACGEWILCPTRVDGTEQDCSKAPQVVSCSWGSYEGDPTYDPVTAAWIAGGIVPVFAIGNTNSGHCGIITSPGDREGVIGVGATNKNHAVASFSGRGPSPDGRTKPDISAPGLAIYVPDNDDNQGYTTASGTSMATPAVAGVAALALSVNPNLTVDQVKQILFQGVDRNLISSNEQCGGIPDNVFPNNHFGHGRTNALKVVQLAQALLQQSQP